MLRLNKYELGKKALTILQCKIKRNGMDLRPDEFARKVTKLSQLIDCPREEVISFYEKFLIPHVIRGCQMKTTRFDESAPSEEEARIAYRVLKIDYFWDISDLREEAQHIVDKTSLKFEEVAAIAIHIAKKHLKNEFGEGEALELEVTD